VAINRIIKQVSRMKSTLLPLRLNELLGGTSTRHRFYRRRVISLPSPV
jgi:hypothetical protein